jgi:hypothetical protein
MSTLLNVSLNAEVFAGAGAGARQAKYDWSTMCNGRIHRFVRGAVADPANGIYSAKWFRAIVEDRRDKNKDKYQLVATGSATGDVLVFQFAPAGVPFATAADRAAVDAKAAKAGARQIDGAAHVAKATKVTAAPAKKLTRAQQKAAKRS